MLSLTIIEDIIRRYILKENGHQFFNDLKSGGPMDTLVTGLIDTEFGCYFLSIFEVNAHLKIIFDTYGEIMY